MMDPAEKDLLHNSNSISDLNLKRKVDLWMRTIQYEYLKEQTGPNSVAQANFLLVLFVTHFLKGKQPSWRML